MSAPSLAHSSGTGRILNRLSRSYLRFGGPRRLPAFQLTRWKPPNGHVSFSDTAAVCAPHGCVYRLDSTSVGKRPPLGQTRGRLVPFSLTAALATCAPTEACPVTDLIAAMTATGSAF